MIAASVPPNPLYSEPEWLKSAAEWITSRLQHDDIRITGRIDQTHIRPWSTVLSIPTDSGIVIFKAAIEAWNHETPITVAISRRCPYLTPKLIAADPDRNWMLMRHGGMSLRTILKQRPDIDRWSAALLSYARLQRLLAPHSDELIGLGAEDRRLSTLPLLYAKLLEEAAPLRLGEAGGISKDEHASLRALAQKFESDCGRLEQYGIVETIQHDDLHDNNILVNDAGEEPYLFFDWGDSCVAHPFFSLVVATRSIGWTLGVDAFAPAVGEVTGPYLEEWGDEMPLANLRDACSIAARLGIVCRALTWYKLLPGIDPTFESDLGGGVVQWLREYLNAEQACK